MSRMLAKALKKAGRKLSRGIAMAPKIIPHKHRDDIRRATKYWLKEV